MIVHHGRVSRHIEHEGGFSDGRSRSKDDEVGRLPSEGDLVQRREAGRHSAVAGHLLALLHLLHCGLDQVADALDIFLDTVLDCGKDIGLGHINERIHIYAVIESLLEDGV